MLPQSFGFEENDMQDKVRRLDAQQTTSFDREYIDKGMFEVLTKQTSGLPPFPRCCA